MAAGKNILVVEDETDLAELIDYNLTREGYACRCVGDGAAALEEARRRPPDLIILDRMLPRFSGDELIARWRNDAATAAVPIIMLTARAEESDELVGFALGADDYITKPFSMKLLLARVAAVLRRGRTGATDADSITVGPVTLDRSRHEVRVHDIPVSLTSTEFKLLKTLMASNGRVLTRDHLIDAVLGHGVAVVDRTIDVHVAALRKKLGEASSWVHTVRGAGYTFREPVAGDA